ncbi:hypothetical protein [Streptomyces sp. DHE17-7]|uniref:hypothetical protein n=1 Tax=Streptomyces sp. DHE17-7 TaxID=2759949 RepID=UPI0022EA8A3E|nr:hypothetical protein [Streptomyces sp. DHE17-7]MBJ6619822.1 hypothetical protein [Streptomyces sp. DHE17-7]
MSARPGTRGGRRRTWLLTAALLVAASGCGLTSGLPRMSRASVEPDDRKGAADWRDLTVVSKQFT